MPGTLRRRTRGSWRAGQREVQSLPWGSAVSHAAAKAWGTRSLIFGGVRLSLLFFFARPAGHYGTGRNARKLKPSAPKVCATKADLSKLERGVEDALSKIIYVDDRQISARGKGGGKYWTSGAEYCEVRVEVEESEASLYLPCPPDMG